MQKIIGKGVAAFAVAALLAGGAGAAVDGKRGDEGHAATVTWRIAPPQWLDDATFETLEKTLVGHRVTGKIALFVTARGFVHHPLPLPELLDEAKVGAKRLARLHALGYEAGFNLLCAIGHLNEMAHTTPRVEGARHNVSAGGGESAADFCLESPAWREKYLTPALTALAQAKPDFIWLDDDVRVCYCADCQARRHRKIGSPLGVKEMGAWLCEPGTCASRRRALLQDNRESQADFFAFCARVVRAVDPGIALGDMEVVNPAEGLAYPEKFAALGNGAYPTYWRSGCDCWNDETPNDFLVKLNRQAQMSVWLPRANAKFEAEIENWPYQHYGKSVAFTVFETLLNCAVATDGAAYNVLHVESQDPYEVNLPMIDALEGIRPTLDAFVAAAGGERPRGVWNGVGRDTGAVAQPEGTDWTRDFPFGFDRGFLGTDAQKCGFAVAYRAEDADLIAPTALAVRSMTDEELDRMFSGGVYLDHDALLAALGRGREADIGFRAGKWMTDTALEVLTDDPLNAGFAGMVRNARPTLPPYCRVLSVEPVEKGARVLARLVDGNLEEIAPCVQGVYENARGGRVCVNGYTPYVRLGNVHSIRQMRTVMRWLSRDTLSGCLVGDGRALLWVRGDRSVVVVNFGADAEEGLSVDLAGEARSHGLVPVGVPSAVPIAGERRGACTRYRLPALDPWSVNVFAIRKAPAATGDEVVLGPVEGNATPQVVAAVKALKDGDTLRFEKGEYHFFEEGCVRETLSVGGRSWGEKKVVFDFEGRRGIMVDGGGSMFVWHGNVFPFSFRKCSGVTVKNVTARAHRPSYVELTIDRYLDDGGCEFVFKPGVAYRVEDGALLFETDLGTFDSRRTIISVHALERMAIHFLFAGNETTDRRGLPSSFLNGVAEDLGGGRVRIANRRQNLPGCLARYPFRVGEPLCLLLNGRERCTLHFAECRDVSVCDVRVQSGDGMGLVSFLNENVTIDGYCVEPREGDKVSITADCLFVVNNRGLVEVKNSTFSWALDDAINMHGNYLRVAAVRGDELELEHIHREYYNFQPHHAGDTVEFTDPVTRDVLGTATVVSVSERADGAVIRVKGLASAVPKGTLVENLTWLPEVRLHDNVFHDVLHVRLSGRGKYTVERNVFRRGIALLVNDLATYWGEAGRTGDMTIRNNLFDCFSARGWNGSFVNVEVDGRGGRELKIHRGIRIEDNRVRGLPKGVPLVNAPCALDPVIRNNMFEPTSP